MARRSSSKNNSSATLGFEAGLWLAAPFNFPLSTFEFERDSDWLREDDDVRWQFGLPEGRLIKIAVSDERS